MPERNAIAPVKIAASALRILVKADLAPFLGREIAVKRFRFPVFPQRHLGAEPDDSVAAGAAMAPSTEIPRHSTGRLQLLRHHGCKRPSADRAADAAGCRPHEGHVRAQADRARSIFTDSLDQGVAVEVTVARGIAHPVADLRDTWVAGTFDMTHQSLLAACPRPPASGGVHGRKAYSSTAAFRSCTDLRLWIVAYC